VSSCERFRLKSKRIADVFLRHFNAVWDGLERAQDQSGPHPPMAWFFFTLMVLHLFSDEQVDVIVLEVGLSGRLVTTNVFCKPVVRISTTTGVYWARHWTYSHTPNPASSSPTCRPFRRHRNRWKCKCWRSMPRTDTGTTPTLDGFGLNGVNCNMSLLHCWLRCG
jgi:hypothetical protein